MVEYKRQCLDSGWEFKQVGAVGVPETVDGYLPVAQFPTNIHLDLLAHGKIPDPFIGLNEYKVQWVGEQQWTYRTSFNSHTIKAEGEKLILQFDGLDTFATVTLNGFELLVADNMHRTFRVDVTKRIKEGRNELEILFDSAIIRGMKQMKETGFKPAGFTSSTDKSRLLVRKAQYHYAWNWGPELTTCGPWRRIYLEHYSARIADFWCSSQISVQHQTAALTASVDIEVAKQGDGVIFVLFGPDGSQLLTSDLVTIREGHASTVFKVQDAQFWWPVGLGGQPLYRVVSRLMRNGIAVHEMERRIGLRTASIIQNPLKDQPGTSFFFQINGTPVFSSGSNWCPADHFVPRVTKERYQHLLKMFVKSNQNMIRVWGGAVYEEDIFYDICDELGILVWNDFMFACGTYPADDVFQANITAEVEDNLRRLRNHPSIVGWSGNNEDYLFAELFHTQYNPKDLDPENWLKTNFPARYIYEKLLPEMCSRLIPDTSYHPGSPWGGKSFNDPTVGDTHMWEVWHHLSRPWQDYPKLGSRFVSEFGISSLPHVKTIESYLIDSPASERHPHSRTVDHHNKEMQHERKIAMYLIENFKFGYGLEEYIYITQLNQAEAMTCAMRAWRREWKGAGMEYCGGSLIWQFNPTWQVTSKSLVDYFNRPKLAYFTVKRDIAPLSLGLERKEIKHPKSEFTRAFIDTETRILGWATNVTLKPVSCTFTIQAFELSTGKEIYSGEETVKLPANKSTELFDMELPKGITKDEPIIVATTLKDSQGKDGRVLARCTNWPQPYRYLEMPPPDLKVEVEGEKIFVSSQNVPVKGFALYVDDVDAVEFDDNCLDLVPGDRQVVVAKGLGQREVTWRYYGMDTLFDALRGQKHMACADAVAVGVAFGVWGADTPSIRRLAGWISAGKRDPDPYISPVPSLPLLAVPRLCWQLTRNEYCNDTTVPVLYSYSAGILRRSHQRPAGFLLARHPLQYLFATLRTTGPSHPTRIPSGYGHGERPKSEALQSARVELGSSATKLYQALWPMDSQPQALLVAHAAMGLGRSRQGAIGRPAPVAAS